MKLDLEKTIENLFYIIVFLLPWQAVWLWREPFIGEFKWEYGAIGIYGIDFLIILFLMLGLVEYFRGFNSKFQIPNSKSISNVLISKFKKNTLFQLLVTSYGLLCLSFLSILWSSDKFLALYFSWKLFLAIGLFWTIRRIGFSWNKLVFVLLLAGALQGALGVGQFLAQETFSSKWLGMSAHEAAQGGVSVLENSSGRWLRAYGSFPHPNILGGYLAIILLLVIGHEIKREKNLKFQNYCDSLYYTAIILIFSGLIVSFSRSALLVFMLGLGILFWLQKNHRKELGKILLIFIGTALIWLSVFSPLFLVRTQGGSRLEKKSVTDRVEYIKQAREIIREHFWLGVGAGNYTQAVHEKNPQKKIWEVQPVHNVFLLVLAELGVVGLVICLIFFGNFFKKIFQKEKKVAIVFGTAFCILVFSDHWLWTSHFGAIFVGAIYGLLWNAFKILQIKKEIR